jgi:hypothetical protein
MHLDDLLASRNAASRDPVIARLCKHIGAWKANEATAVDLRELVERYIGNTWIEREGDHRVVYGLWSKFRDEAIDALSGMTMNERSSAFSLFERYDATSDEAGKATVLKKLRTPEEVQTWSVGQ